MAYATTADLLSRAGAVRDRWENGSDPPGISDLEAYLKTEAAKLDATLAARGFETPVEGAAADALVGLNADMALLVALGATFVGRDNVAVQQLRDATGRRVDNELSSVEAGTHAAILLLESGGSGAGDAGGATSLWHELDRRGDLLAGPSVRRGQIF